MAYVIDVAKHYDIDVRIGIYGTMAYMKAPLSSPEGDTIDETLSDKTIVAPSGAVWGALSQTQENFDFVALYDQWRGGHLRLRCQSIMSCLVVHSNGDVPLCQNLDVVLGNIHEQTLDEIFNGASACQTQCQYSKDCNDCWINFHRKYDIILVRNFERLLPKWLIEKFYGQYQWTADPKQTYRKHLKAIQ
jgi:hypothetical protein